MEHSFYDGDLAKTVLVMISNSIESVPHLSRKPLASRVFPLCFRHSPAASALRLTNSTARLRIVADGVDDIESGCGRLSVCCWPPVNQLQLHFIETAERIDHRCEADRKW